jgi:hypothetical protein
MAASTASMAPLAQRVDRPLRDTVRQLCLRHGSENDGHGASVSDREDRASVRAPGINCIA